MIVRLFEDEEVVRRVAGDPLDLVGDHLELVLRVPGAAVDRAGHVLHQRPQQAVVGALLRGAQPGPGARDQLRAGERPVQVVVGARVEHRVGHPALGGDGDGQHPRVPEPLVLTQHVAHLGRVQPRRVAVDDDQVDRLLLQRRPGRRGTPNRPREMPRGPQPGLDLGLGGTDDENPGLAPTNSFTTCHAPNPKRAARVPLRESQPPKSVA